MNANWNNPTLNRVIITGLDDSIIDGDVALKLVTGDPQSTDPAYDNLDASDVADVDFINIDNDNQQGMIINDKLLSNYYKKQTNRIKAQWQVCSVR